MKRKRRDQMKFWNLDIKLSAVFGDHVIAAAHAAEIGGERADAFVFESLSTCQAGLQSDNSCTANLFDSAVGIGDDPVAAHQLSRKSGVVGDGDFVGEEMVIRFGPTFGFVVGDFHRDLKLRT